MPMSRAESVSSIMVRPNDLVWKQMPSLPPGAVMAMIEGSPETIFTQAVPFTFRLKLPANYEIPAHHHPFIEHATVISGTLHMGYGDKVDRSNSTTLPAGSVAVMQPDTKHFSWTEEETIVQIHGVGPLIVHYADPEKDPRKK
jgi:hypothetical protein